MNRVIVFAQTYREAKDWIRYNASWISPYAEPFAGVYTLTGIENYTAMLLPSFNNRADASQIRGLMQGRVAQIVRL